MKLSISIVPLLFSLLVAAALDVRQHQCTENGCYRAIWGDLNLPRALEAVTDCQSYLTTSVIVHPVTTTTIISKVTSATTTGCPITASRSSVFQAPTMSALIPTFTAQVGARQAPLSNSSTSTIHGSIPSYATMRCQPSGYASACSCAGITRARVTYLAALSTTQITTTSTVVSTVTAPCSNVSSSISTTASVSSTTLTITSLKSNNPTSTRTTLSLPSSIITLSINTTSMVVSSSSSSLGSSSGVSYTNHTCTTATTSSSSSNSLNASTITSRTPATSNTASFSPSNSISISLVSRSSSLSSATSSSTSISSSISSTSISSMPSSSTASSLSASTTSGSLLSSSTTPTPTPSICVGPGIQLCGASCYDTKSDINHCGSCGNTCSSGQECLNGVCASPPCDSRCGWDRICGTRNSTVACTCASSVEGSGICFDKNQYSCDDSSLITCQQSAFGNGGCPVGSACVKDYCNCGGSAPQSGICVRTDGCGSSGVNVLGPLVRLGEMERRRRMMVRGQDM